MPCWINGVPSELISVRDRGLAYGDGLFETLTVRRGQVRLLERHLERLWLGCQRLSIALDMSVLRAELLAFAELAGNGVVKLMVTRGEGQRGYALPEPQHPVRILQHAGLPDYPAGNREKGIRLFICSVRLAEQPLLAGIKHLNRLEQVLARAEWHDPQFAEGLLRDRSGRVIEGVFSNLFLAAGGRLLTPDLARCGVAGVMRAEIIARAAALDIPCEVRDIDYEQLLVADELFVCNSLYGIWPVRELAGRILAVGDITRTLQLNLQDLIGD